MTIEQAFPLAVQHHQAGRLAEAEALYRQILAMRPNHSGALHLLGVVVHQTGHSELAVTLINQAILLCPNDSVARVNLGEIYRALGRLEDSKAEIHRALQINPNDPAAYINLGNVQRLQGQLDDAAASYRRALQLEPKHHVAWNNLGNACCDQGALDKATATYRRALELRPDYVEAHNNLGTALRIQGRFEEALAAYRQALALQPDFAEAHYNLGVLFNDRWQLDEAVASYRRALALRPAYTDARNNLGNTLKEQGEFTAALAAFRQALALTPDQPSVHSNLIFTLYFDPESTEQMVTEEQQRWNQRFSEPQKPRILPHGNDRDPDRRLRIGYVSPDFWDHVVGRNVRPLFQHHDHQHFQIVCYSGVARPDEITAEFQQHADLWRSTVGVTDDAVAGMIRADGIDILVDLSLHSASNRLPIFARQPAPVQVSFAGYPESAGVEAIGYRISDRWLEGEHRMTKESVFTLDSFWCYDPCGVEVEVNELPARAIGNLTFGCLSNFNKVNEPVLRLWARVLREVATARLIILCDEGSHRQRTARFLEREGIAGERIEFLPRCPRREYLELYHRLDIALDPFPYNGHTTSLDALWMGVPVVSLAGKRPLARAGLSILSNIGLVELVADSEEEYVGIASHLSQDLPRLVELRRTLRPRMETSVLVDAPRFAHHIESAYRAMWRQWCTKKGSEC